MRKAVADQMLLPWRHSQLLAVSLTDQCAKRLKEVLPSGGGWYVYHFLEQLLGEVEWVRQQGGNPVILAPDSLRRSLFELLPAHAGLTVFGYEEIPPSLEFEVAAVVGSQLHPDQRHWPGRRFVSDSFQAGALS
jgi:flagellar biosynthesis component FlhA